MKIKIFLLPAILLFALAFIFSCSQEDDEFYGFCLKGSCFEHLEDASSSSEELSSATATSSSSFVAQSSSSEEQACLGEFCFTPGESSSSLVASSSSSVIPSSSSAEPLPVLTCAGSLPNKATAGTRIPPPAVECNGVKVANSNITWIGAPNWNNPAKGDYTNIKAFAKAGSGACSGMTTPDACEITGGALEVSNCGDFEEGTQRLHYGKYKPQFCDEQSGKKYVYTEIGDQTWMAENLNYAAPGSKCYGEGGNVANKACFGDMGGSYNCEDSDYAPLQGNIESICNTYGRLYNWATAMKLDQSCNTAECSDQVIHPHQGVCPEGWHIPNRKDWNNLFLFVEGNYDFYEDDYTDDKYQSHTAGKFLKASYWQYSENDPHGFSALPGGGGFPAIMPDEWDFSEDDFFAGNYLHLGVNSFWWTSSESSEDRASRTSLREQNDYALYVQALNFKSFFYSVRCIKDANP